MKQAYQLPEVKTIEANAAHQTAQQCGVETIGLRNEYWGLGRISAGTWPSSSYTYQPGDGGAMLEFTS